MAVYRRGYERYQGELTGSWTRLLSLPRFAWRQLLQQRLIVVFLIVALFWPLACAFYVYLANHAELWQGLSAGFIENLLRIDSRFFIIFMNVQAVFAMFLAAFAGPSLIAPDLANNALPLYFSRPLSRPGYVLARFLVLAGLLSPVTWIPGILLFAMQSGMAGWGWFSVNWMMAPGILAGFALWIALLGLVAMACSAYAKWRIVAGALVLGYFFVLAGAAQIVRNVLRADWAYAINPVMAMDQIWRLMLGAEPGRGPGPLASGLVLIATAAVFVWVLERKLWPVEVIS
jgi:ABC-2 type transport system permease protein